MSSVLSLADSRRAAGGAAVVVAIGAAALAVAGVDGAGVVALGVLVGITLTLHMHLPRGGSIPMGHAVVIAAAFQLSAMPFAAVCVVALGVARIVSTRTKDGAFRASTAALGMIAAGLTAAAVHPHVPDRDADGWAQAALLAVLAIGCAYVVVDLVLERESDDWSWRATTPVYVALISSAALLAMASDWLLVFAALPLIITWYSFERYSAARRTYEQTIQALGIVPELAGHVAIGHGERTAAYARALVGRLEVPVTQRDHVVVAARLHHVGHVAVPDCEDTKPAIEDAVVASASGRILRESGFLPEIAALVESLAEPRDDDILVATLRVASAFDDLVGEDAARANGALAILGSRAEGRAWTRVVDELRALLDAEDDDIVGAAIAEGAPLTAAAAAAASGAMTR